MRFGTDDPEPNRFCVEDAATVGVVVSFDASRDVVGGCDSRDVEGSWASGISSSIDIRKTMSV